MTRRERNHSKRSSKRALTGSILAIVLCVVLLAGATFAWFTDTASTKVSKIESGTLKIDLTDADGNSVKGTTLNFVKAKDGKDQDILWEPGAKYELQPLTIKNVGTLALKYRVEVLGITASGEEAKLNEAIDWTITAGVKSGEGANLIEGTTDEYFLLPGETAELTISGKMEDTAGNEYQGLSIDSAAINVVATQYTYEYDSNGNTYDAGATLPSIWDGESKQAPAQVDGVYHITNAAEFVYCLSFPGGTDDRSFVLDSDIDLGGNVIENSGVRHFDGYFDGQNHVVSNFTMKNSSELSGGLFGYTGGSNNNTYIKNLIVRNATIDNSHSGGQVGVIIGGVNERASVENCKVYDSTIIGEKKVGSVVGYVSNGTVKDCYAENCTVISADERTNQAGEVIGYINTGSTTENNTFKNVTVITGGNVAIASNATELANAIQAGGTVLLTKDITVDSWTSVKVATGDMYQQIADSITINGGGHIISGLTQPLLGANAAANVTIENLTIKNSDIDNTNGTDNDVNSGAFISYRDGLGTGSLTMRNCHVADSKITAKSDGQAGGLIGYCSDSNVTIENCSVTGCTISGEKVGGIVGSYQVATGSIKNCTVSGCTLSGTEYSGQIAGQIFGGGTLTLNGCTYTGEAFGRTVTGTTVNQN